MAIFKPFTCIRPRGDVVSRMAARPYDVMSAREARREVAGNSLSFLNLSRPEVHFPEEDSPTSEQIHEMARQQLDRWLAEGVLEEDETPGFYVYELSVGGHEQTGLVGCASVDDYWNHVVRQHEKVRTDKLEDRTMHIRRVGAQTGPVFLTYRSRREINTVIERVKQFDPLYDFHGGDGVYHRVWKIWDRALQAVLERNFAGLDTLYIADGHHRAFAAARVCEMCRQEDPDYTGEEPFNYFMAVCFPDDQLEILPYNRVVADLQGMTSEEFLEKIGEYFTVADRGTAAYTPRFKGVFGMYLGGRWYKLVAKRSVISRDPVKGLDVAILQDYLLGPILGIGDPRTDRRIDFVGGIRGLRELEYRCGMDMAVAFSLYPTSIRELFAVADHDLLMPPKSTWFEPKLASGLFLHRI